MKNYLLVAGLSLLVIEFISCKKKPDVVTPVKDTVCQITRMTYSSGPGDFTSTGTFTYNTLGNPVSFTKPGGGTGNPNSLFIYDQYNRLKDFISIHLDITDPANLPARFDFEYLIRFVYADNNPLSMPVKDTIRAGGQVIGGIEGGQIVAPGTVTVDTLIYDSQGRIVPARGLNPEGGFSEGKGYDANGNLILPNTIYDNKKNFRQTNKILMLVDKNFSKNNAYEAVAYNDNGYPTIFPQPVAPRRTLDIFLGRVRYIQTMEYACSLQAGQ